MPKEEKKVRDPGSNGSATWPSDGERGPNADGAFRGNYRALLERVSDMVTVSDREGRIVYANPATERVSGYTPEEFVALDPFSRMHPDDRPRCEEAFGRLLNTPGLSLALEHRFRHKDGSWRWAEGTFEGLFDDPEIGGLVATVRDVTEEKQTEEALRKSEERLQLALDASAMGTFTYYPEEDRGEPDARMLGLFGLPEDGVLNLAVALETMIHPEDRVRYAEAVARSTDPAGSGELREEIRVIHPDGTEHWVSVMARVTFQGGRPTRMVGSAMDVTVRKQADEDRERLRASEAAMQAEDAERERISRELHDRVAHHMGVAHQSLELFSALRESTPERAADRLALARKTTKRALDQTRALSAELKRLQDEELKDGMEAAFGKIVGSYVPDGVEVELSFSGEESSIPRPLATQVYLTMREAVRNAVKHSGCSRLAITLEIRDGELRGLVVDDGEGFDPEAMEAATPSFGVGLWSMRERAEMLGGSLRVGSEPGTGTRVEVRAPLDRRRS